MEWEISGPEAPKSCDTHEEILPKVVVGELNVDVKPVSKNSVWYCSKRPLHIKRFRLISYT